MIIHDMKQRTPEWYAVRAGKLTGSIASKLVTPTGRLSTQYKSEIGRIIAEKMDWQEPEEGIETAWMTRGSELEHEARCWFTVETGLKVKEVGFIESDDGMTGFSPDGLADHPKMASIIPVELKVPKPSTHIRWLLDDELPVEHRAQVHFGMVITDAPVAYFMSYAQHCRPLILEVERDEYTDTMSSAIHKYIVEFEDAFKNITGVDYASL